MSRPDAVAEKVEFVMPTGITKWFNDEKGFGFIQPDDGGEDLFVHHSDIQTDGYASLQEDQQVEYTASQGPKGPKAIDVRPL